MITAIISILVESFVILQCQKLWMKVEGLSSIQCAIGVNKIHGNGQNLLQILGELLGIFRITGNLLQIS